MTVGGEATAGTTTGVRPDSVVVPSGGFSRDPAVADSPQPVMTITPFAHRLAPVSFRDQPHGLRSTPGVWPIDGHDADRSADGGGVSGRLLNHDFRVTGGTSMSGLSVGLFVCHCVAFSYAFASASTFPSEKRGPAIISPIGSPLFEKPHGSEMAGNPKILKGVQFEMVSGSRGTTTSSRFRASLMVRGRIESSARPPDRRS